VLTSLLLIKPSHEATDPEKMRW